MGGGIETYFDRNVRSAEEVLLIFRHAALISSINLLSKENRLNINNYESMNSNFKILQTVISNIYEVKFQKTNKFDALMIFNTENMLQYSPNNIILNIITSIKNTISHQTHINAVYQNDFDIIIEIKENPSHRLTPIIVIQQDIMIPSEDSNEWIPLKNSY